MLLLLNGGVRMLLLLFFMHTKIFLGRVELTVRMLLLLKLLLRREVRNGAASLLSAPVLSDVDHVGERGVFSLLSLRGRSNLGKWVRVVHQSSRTRSVVLLVVLVLGVVGLEKVVREYN